MFGNNYITHICGWVDVEDDECYGWPVTSRIVKNI